MRTIVLLCLGLNFTYSAANTDRKDELVKIFFVADYDAPSDECLLHILNLEKQNKKQFKDEEVIWAAEGFLDPRGEVLKRRKHCFTCQMRVLTPHGYVEIERLRVGEKIYSWNEDAKKLVMNEVSAVHDSDDQEFGELLKTPTGISLQVTSGHEFFVPERSTFTEIGSIGAQQNLLAIDATDCSHYLMTRGEYKVKGVGHVRTISVGRAPYNFVIEGFVVHNKLIPH